MKENARVYEVSSFENLSPQDLDNIYADTRLNQAMVDHIFELISQDGIVSFDFFRVSLNYEFHYIGTTPLAEFREYFRLGFWQIDDLYGTTTQESYRAIYYGDLTQHDTPKTFSIPMHLTLVNERLYANHKDVLLFNMTKELFDSLSIKHRAHLFQRLRSTMNLIYKAIHFHTIIQAGALDVELFKSHTPQVVDKPSMQKIKALYQLTDNDLIYLKMIASGGSAKEMAQHLNKSYRYVQNIIHELTQKLRILDKGQLENVAQIIMTYE
ncbi:helix-turn-helix transcriptional regulator [Cysteiniphilum litorale]|uniref:helix-turn-helix transcriptional regulator n=1 Tax=Cysteiniphilum litorale TaxID=2056700 RepID=UPI003F8827C0